MFKDIRLSWGISPGDGFWREDAYLELNGCYRYSGGVTLEQTCIISDDEAVTYYLWNTCFTKETLIKEAEEAGFKVCEIFGDVAGETYSEDKLTIEILLEK